MNKHCIHNVYFYKCDYKSDLKLEFKCDYKSDFKTEFKCIFNCDLNNF